MIIKKLDEIRRLWQEIFERSFIYKLDYVAREGIWLFEKIINVQLNYIIENRKNKTEENAEDIEVEYYEDKISNYIRTLNNIVERAIDEKCYLSIDSGLNGLRFIADHAVSLGLSNSFKTDIVSSCFLYHKLLTIRCINEGISKYISSIKYLDIYETKHILEKSVLDYSRIPLMRYGEVIIYLADNNSLEKYQLNKLGALGRGCISKVDKSKIHREAVLYISQILDKIRQIIEIGKCKDLSLYFEVQKQLKSFQNWMNSKKVTDVTLSNEINKVLSQFKPVIEKNNLFISDSIEWPKSD